MKKLVVGALSAALVFGSSIGICDAKRHDRNVRHERNYSHQNQRIREDAGYVIHRTAEAVYAAQRSVQKHRHNRRNHVQLKLAVAHQRRARELYMKGFYRDAINHSLRARNLAFEVLQANREKPRREYYRDSREEEYGRNAPKDKDVDIKIDITKVGDDFEISRFRLDID